MTVASAYVPCNVGGAVATTARGGRLWIDAGAATSMDALCAALGGGGAGGPACLRINAIALGPLGNATTACQPVARPPGTVAAGAYPGYPPATPPTALPLACGAYAAANGGRSAYDDFFPVRAALTPGAICPGCRVRTALTQCDVDGAVKFKFSGATTTAKARQAWAVVQLGYEEGAAWAREKGFRRFF